MDSQYSYDLYHRLGGGPEDVEMDICLALGRDALAQKEHEFRGT